MDEGTPQFADGLNPSVPSHVLGRVVVDAHETRMELLEEDCGDCGEAGAMAPGPRASKALTSEAVPAWTLFVLGFIATAGVLLVLRARGAS